MSPGCGGRSSQGEPARGAVAEQRFDVGHRPQQPFLTSCGQGGEEGGDVGFAATVERGEGAPAGGREGEMEVAGIARRALAADQLLLLERAQQAAQVAGVEVEVARQLGRGAATAMGQLPEQTGFGEREAAVGELLVEDADPAGVEAG